MKNLSRILRALMEEGKLSESELARRCQVGQPVIHRILSGETDNPRVATLSLIANYFSLSISQLIGDQPLPNNRLPGTHNLAPQALTLLPIISWETVLTWPCELASPQMTSTDLLISPEGFALSIKDSTMMPRFSEGSLLITDPNRHAIHRDFVIAQVKDQHQAIFRQLLIDGTDFYLKPLNADYKTQHYRQNELRLLGTVIQVREDL